MMMVLRAADININDARQRRRRRRRRRRSVRVGRRTHRTEHERACHHQRHASSSNARRRRRRRRRAHVRPKGAELCRSVSRFKTDPCEQRRVMNRHTLDGIQSKKCTCMRKQYLGRHRRRLQRPSRRSRLNSQSPRAIPRSLQLHRAPSRIRMRAREETVPPARASAPLFFVGSPPPVI